jgi:surface polysaccharide O-acyltransferase-like enzyme
MSVISIHTTPFNNSIEPIGNAFDLATFVNQAARFAVPFFFIISGYFWANKFTDRRQLLGPTVKMAKRIAFLFVAWSTIYLLPANIYDAFSYGNLGPIKLIYWNLATALSHPLTTVVQGTKTHLWFMMSLLLSIIISAVFIRFNLRRALIIVAAALYVIGLAGKAYSDTPIGFHVNFNFRDGPFFSLILFVTGYILQRRGPEDTWAAKGVFVLILGLVMHFTEILLIHHYYGTPMNQDYVAGTYFMGVGTALIALSNTNFLSFKLFSSIGPLVLGIYASHFTFIETLKPLDREFCGNPIWDLIYIGLVLLLSIYVTTIFSNYRLTRNLVQ